MSDELQQLSFFDYDLETNPLFSLQNSAAADYVVWKVDGTNFLPWGLYANMITLSPEAFVYSVNAGRKSFENSGYDEAIDHDLSFLLRLEHDAKLGELVKRTPSLQYYWNVKDGYALFTEKGFCPPATVGRLTIRDLDCKQSPLSSQSGSNVARDDQPRKEAGSESYSGLPITPQEFGASSGECEDKWPPEMGPQFACTTLTNELLVGLEGASIAEVRKAMHAQGGPGGADHFRFLVPIGKNGYVMIGLDHDRVIYISAMLDHELVPADEDHDARTEPAHFIWRAGRYFCSDLPGAHPKGKDCKGLQDADNMEELQKALSRTK